MKPSKTNPFPVNTPSYQTREMKELFEAVLRLKNTDEAAKFFRDLLTIAELKEFANRWQTVKMLVQGKSYAGIAEKLGMSTATVTRDDHWLHFGLGGYRTIADRVFGKQKK